MIFLTVGSDLPFDRLVRTVDQWAGESGRTDIFAQIGETDFIPTNLEHTKLLAPADFKQRFNQASLIIAHAGMGTILSAFQAEKPILVMPRLASLRETRNEHQTATARRLLETTTINVAFTEAELLEKLTNLETLPRPARISPYASEELLTALREFIGNGRQLSPARTEFSGPHLVRK